MGPWGVALRRPLKGGLRKETGRARGQMGALGGTLSELRDTCQTEDGSRILCVAAAAALGTYRKLTVSPRGASAGAPESRSVAGGPAGA